MNLSIHPDTIILGCTHFSLLKEEIKKILYKKRSIYFIDSIHTITSEIQNHFDQSRVNQNIKKNIFLYSKNDNDLKKLLFFLKKYKFKVIKHINLN